MSNFNPLYADELSRSLLQEQERYRPTATMDNILPGRDLNDDDLVAAYELFKEKVPQQNQSDFILPESQYSSLSDYPGNAYPREVSTTGAGVLSALEGFKEAQKRDKTQLQYLEEYKNALNQQSDNIKQQIQSKEQQKIESEAFMRSMEDLQKDKNIIIEGIKNLKPQKDSLGVALGKALAVGLGAFGASMTGSPNYAWQIIQSGTEEAANRLSFEREKSYKLLGLNKEQQDELNKRYSDRQSYQKFLQSSLLQNNIDILKSKLEFGTPQEAAKARIVLNDALIKKEEIDASLGIQSAKLAQEGMKQQKEMKSAPVGIDMSDEDFNRLDQTAQTKLREASVKLDETLNAYENIKNIVNDYEYLNYGEASREQKARMKAAEKDVLVTLKELYNLGAITGPDLELIGSEFSLTSRLPENRRIALAELGTKLFMASKNPMSVIKSSKGARLNKESLLKLQDLGATAVGKSAE